MIATAVAYYSACKAKGKMSMSLFPALIVDLVAWSVIAMIFLK